MHLSHMKRELLVQVSRELGAHEDIHGFRFLGYDPRTTHAGKETEVVARCFWRLDADLHSGVRSEVRADEYHGGWIVALGRQSTDNQGSARLPRKGRAWIGDFPPLNEQSRRLKPVDRLTAAS